MSTATWLVVIWGVGTAVAAWFTWRLARRVHRREPTPVVVTAVALCAVVWPVTALLCLLLICVGFVAKKRAA